MLAVAVLAAALLCGAAAADPPYNILFIMADQVTAVLEACLCCVDLC